MQKITRLEKKQPTDAEYLKRPLLDVKYVFEKDYISISSDHTGYVRAKREQRLRKEDLLSNYKAVLKAAKERGISISYRNHLKRRIEDGWEQYREEYKGYTETFDKMVSAYKTVQKRGLHSGTSDDRVLDAAYKVRYTFERYTYRDTTLSQMMWVDYYLRDLLETLGKPYDKDMGRIARIYI